MMKMMKMMSIKFPIHIHIMTPCSAREAKTLRDDCDARDDRFAGRAGEREPLTTLDFFTKCFAHDARYARNM